MNKPIVIDVKARKFEELERLLARNRECQKGNPNAEFHIEAS